MSIAKLVNSQRDPNLVCLASDHTRMRVLRCSKNATSRSWHSDIKSSSQILALNLGNGGMGWLFMLLWVILPFPTFSTSFIKGLNIDDLWKHQPESVFFSYTWKTKGGRVPSTPTIGAGSCSLVRIKYIYIYYIYIYILYIYIIYIYIGKHRWKGWQNRQLVTKMWGAVQSLSWSQTMATGNPPIVWCENHLFKEQIQIFIYIIHIIIHILYLSYSFFIAICLSIQGRPKSNWNRSRVEVHPWRVRLELGKST